MFVHVRFHRLVQSDLNEILAKYEEISETLAEQFFAEFESVKSAKIPLLFIMMHVG